MNIIEPCCAEQRVGHLLRENRGHAALMQTNGDVTLEHWIKAVMLMSGDRPRTLTLAVPILTDTIIRVVARCMRLEWVAKLRLMTTDPLTCDIVKQFAKKADCEIKAFLERIELAASVSIPDGLLAFSGPDGMVAIQGRIYDTVTPGLSLYAGIFGRTDSAGIRTIMDTWNANFRARQYEIAIESQQTEQEAKPKKKRTTRRNIKNNETKPMEAVERTPQSEEENKRAE